MVQSAATQPVGEQQSNNKRAIQNMQITTSKSAENE
jgi:hypothetical protein